MHVCVRSSPLPAPRPPRLAPDAEHVTARWTAGLSQPPSRTRLLVNKSASPLRQPPSTLRPAPAASVACTVYPYHTPFRTAMADRRGVRAARRRGATTPQPQSKTTATHPGRASRARSLRSASREIADFVDVQKPTRRGTRQASITEVVDDSENEPKQARRTKREDMKEALEGQ